MSYKRLIPCIFIKDGKAVRWIDDPTVVSKDVIELAKYYSDHGADELIVLDLSDSDEEHDETITLMKRINRVIRIPMIAGGNIRRQEDIKKILYTGAKRAMLNFSKPDSVKLIEDASYRDKVNAAGIENAKKYNIKSVTEGFSAIYKKLS